MAYKSLREKSRFLKELTIGSNATLRTDEITEAEEYADSLIEGFLGKSWPSGSVPDLIEKLADMLGSAQIYRFLLKGQTPKKSEYATSLEEKATGLLNSILDGRVGLKLPDGTWDEDYPGERNKEKKGSSVFEIIG